MSDPPSRFAAFLAELRQHLVFQVAIVYAGVAFIIVQGLCVFCIFLTGGTIDASNAVEPQPLQQEKPDYPDPRRFEETIYAFQAQDKTAPPPEGAIVCIGSSSMRGWHGTIQMDLAPLTIIPRGFGGSTMHDALYYAERIVIAYKPRAVVLYEGDNDIALGISPEQVLETFFTLVSKIHNAFPQTRIYVLSIKPSIARWNFWPQMQEANQFLKAACEANALLTYIDVAAPMLNEHNEPKKEIFVQDMLHMNEKGYILWKAAVRPVLLKSELQHE